jgi:hypothetical protein
MQVIEYGESCFGSFLIIDGENINPHEYDERGDEYINQLKLKLVNELPNVIDKLSIYDLKKIAQLIVENNSDWEYNEDGSKTSTCEQCRNYNYNEIYTRISLL